MILRFIPVYTGNSFTRELLGKRQSVYPCVYRELIIIKIVLNDIAGLSLCIQGTHVGLFGQHSDQRFIPVYTGNSHINRVASFLSSVYPCVYRELIAIWLNTVNQCGLSLCIQGTRRLFAILRLIFRFIPVYTGNSFIIELNI